jgi:ABC-2 type transport system ATP-binding protein
MISVKKLVKQFGSRAAVRDVSFDVQQGEVLGFLGPNGAGKTTTMRMITGFLMPTSGTATVCDIDVTEQPVQARKNIGYLPENAPLYTEMTVEGFLRFIAEMRGFTGRERDARADKVIEDCFLASVRHQTIETLSKGYRQRTCFAQAILHDPAVLIMDEPTEGLDPNQKHVVRNMIRHMSRDKVIVLSTHVLEEVEAICSRIIIISNGVLVADSPPAELKKRSLTYNAVYLELDGHADGVPGVFKELRGVSRVEALDRANGRQRLRLYSRDREPILNEVLDAARSKGWTLRDVRTEEGRLDEVFRNLTSTADVSAEAQREE